MFVELGTPLDPAVQALLEPRTVALVSSVDGKYLTSYVFGEADLSAKYFVLRFDQAPNDGLHNEASRVALRAYINHVLGSLRDVPNLPSDLEALRNDTIEVAKLLNAIDKPQR